jgi:rod shape determining protein RodA
MLQLDERFEFQSGSGFDGSLFGLTVVLAVLGLVNLSSALYSWGEAGGMHLWWWHLVWVLLGLGFMTLLSFWDYRLLEPWKRVIYGLSIVLLLLVLGVGRVVAGHRSWLGVAGFGIQPSEMAKVALMIILAGFFADRPNPQGFCLRELWQPTVLTMVTAVLVAAEGDLGTTIYVILMGLTMALFAGIRWRSVLILAAFLVASGMAAYALVLSPYQQQRINEFVYPRRDVRGHGYQVAQSKIAVGSGQWWGKGYRNGSVNKLKYLPEKHTDFIFPVLAEEWGFVGCSIVVLLYLALMRLAVHIGENARDRFGSFLGVGVAIFLFWQVAINLGGVLGLMPMTGVTLPLLSYGGSSTLSVFVALGLVMSVSRRRNLF